MFRYALLSAFFFIFVNFAVRDVASLTSLALVRFFLQNILMAVKTYVKAVLMLNFEFY